MTDHIPGVHSDPDILGVQDLGCTGITNGALLKLANGQFDALLTVDQGIEYQQNLAGREA